jgi:hypothetical protein
MNTDRLEIPALEAPLDQLERALIDEYVRGRGYDPQHLDNLSNDERHDLLADASVYASTKLTEVESRSRYFHDLHHGAAQYRKKGSTNQP